MNANLSFRQTELAVGMKNLFFIKLDSMLTCCSVISLLDTSLVSKILNWSGKKDITYESLKVKLVKLVPIVSIVLRI